MSLSAINYRLILSSATLFSVLAASLSAQGLEIPTRELTNYTYRFFGDRSYSRKLHLLCRKCNHLFFRQKNTKRFGPIALQPADRKTGYRKTASRNWRRVGSG